MSTFWSGTLCMQAAKALASLRIFADSPESLLLANATIIEISCTVRYIQEVFHVYLNKFENAVTHLFLLILGNN